MRGQSPPHERFFLNLPERRQRNRCWLWLGATSNGYGILNVQGKKTYAHRYSLAVHGIRVSRAKVVDHLCSNRRCVNPTHLEQVTLAENSRRGVQENARRRRIERGLYVP